MLLYFFCLDTCKNFPKQIKNVFLFGAYLNYDTLYFRYMGSAWYFSTYHICTEVSIKRQY